MSWLVCVRCGCFSCLAVSASSGPRPWPLRAAASKVTATERHLIQKNGNGNVSDPTPKSSMFVRRPSKFGPSGGSGSKSVPARQKGKCRPILQGHFVAISARVRGPPEDAQVSLVSFFAWTLWGPQAFGSHVASFAFTVATKSLAHHRRIAQGRGRPGASRAQMVPCMLPGSPGQPWEVPGHPERLRVAPGRCRHL